MTVWTEALHQTTSCWLCTIVGELWAPSMPLDPRPPALKPGNVPPKMMNKMAEHYHSLVTGDCACGVVSGVRLMAMGADAPIMDFHVQQQLGGCKMKIEINQVPAAVRSKTIEKRKRETKEKKAEGNPSRLPRPLARSPQENQEGAARLNKHKCPRALFLVQEHGTRGRGRRRTRFQASEVREQDEYTIFRGAHREHQGKTTQWSRKGTAD